MDQDETWHARRPQPWPHCVGWRPNSPAQKGGRALQFLAHVYCGQTVTVAHLSCWKSLVGFGILCVTFLKRLGAVIIFSEKNTSHLDM